MNVNILHVPSHNNAAWCCAYAMPEKAAYHLSRAPVSPTGNTIAQAAFHRPRPRPARIGNFITFRLLG
jgi:hypothetical protein